MVLTFWVVYTLTFMLMHAVPGGPFDSERRVSEEIKRNLEAKYNLDKPWIEQYLLMLEGIVLRGDFGPSIRLSDYSVNEVIAQGFPVSAALGIFAMVFALSLG